MLLVSLTSFAQTGGSNYLGVWCTIDVNLNDLLNYKTEAKYTINVPPESILSSSPMSGLSIQGPGSPHLINHLGNTIDVEFLKSHLLLEYETEPTECYCELYVDKYVDDFGNPSTSSNGNQCYYLIRVLISKNSI